jgi:hypothetical protein
VDEHSPPTKLQHAKELATLDTIYETNDLNPTDYGTRWITLTIPNPTTPPFSYYNRVWTLSADTFSDG